jgi:precorrin-6B methylase 2
MQVPAGANAGLELLLDPRAEVGYVRGDHEPWLQDLLREWLRPGDEYLDVGSHVGFFALVAARCVGEAGRVVAFEPDPENFARLEANRDRNGLTQIECLKAAAWSSDGRVRFDSSTHQDSGVQGAVVTGGGVEVKLDVEGGEVEALRGAQQLLARRSTHWAVEVHSAALQQEVTEIFERHGYRTRTVAPRHEVYSDYQQDYVIATPD